MRFGLITTATFPIGDVTTIRYSTYCKLLADEGIFVKVYVLTPNTLGISHNGIIENVYYSYLQNQRNNHRFIRYVMGIVAMMRSLFFIKKDKLDIVLIYLTRRVDFIFYGFFAKLLGVKLVTDQTEYLSGDYKKLTTKAKHKIDKTFDRYDGIITISKELYDYHLSIAENKKIFFLPMTMDMHRYDGVKKDKDDKQYISVVFGVHNRDGLDVSIKAYCEYYKICVSNNIVPWKLRLIGNLNDLISREAIIQLISESRIDDHIIIMGKQPIEKVPYLLYNSSCLLTTASTYISGGFPTKLGEYLLSGVPVVVTKAGEIPNFIDDRVHAYLCEVNNITQIAENLYYVHTHPIEAKVIGENGHTLAMTKFNITNYSKELNEFLFSLLTK